MFAVISKNDALKVERGTSIKNKFPSCLAAKPSERFLVQKKIKCTSRRGFRKIIVFFSSRQQMS